MYLEASYSSHVFSRDENCEAALMDQAASYYSNVFGWDSVNNSNFGKSPLRHPSVNVHAQRGTYPEGNAKTGAWQITGDYMRLSPKVAANRLYCGG